MTRLPQRATRSPRTFLSQQRSVSSGVKDILSLLVREPLVAPLPVYIGLVAEALWEEAKELASTSTTSAGEDIGHDISGARMALEPMIAESVRR